MLFNSFEFALFLPLVFIGYWFLFGKNLWVQNFFLLVVSYIFYGWWDWKFLILIFFTSFSSYYLALLIHKNEQTSKRNIYLYLSIFCSLGVLGVFKYYNFFVSNFIQLFSYTGVNLNFNTLELILPVGISFYTFQTLSYTIDVYRKQMKPTQDIVAFFAYIAFFPQLVAGPIERASQLLPQFKEKKIFKYDVASDGVRQIIIGFLKKVVIADNLGIVVDEIFNNHESYGSGLLLLGTFLFAFQLYGDFSGYSDIAIGTAKLFGFKLMQNFRTPYFSKNIGEFWKRWHISLSSWIDDYLYMPLVIATRNWDIKGLYFSLTLSFVLVGLWHGANWNYVLFGLLHGLALVYEARTKKIRKKIRKKASKVYYNFFSIILTFLFWMFTIIFFRSATIGDAIAIQKGIFLPTSFLGGYGHLHQFLLWESLSPIILIFVALLMIREYYKQNAEHSLKIETFPQFQRWGIYVTLIMIIALFGNFHQTQFIYFQF